MNHETRKRELAKKATPTRWYARSDRWHGVFAHPDPDEYFELVKSCKTNNEHIAFHDPETALLEAEVIAAARSIAGYLNKDLPSALYFHQALAALDAHHAKKNGGDK